MLAKGAETEDIPPTKDALVLHVKPANFQAYVWQNCLTQGFDPPLAHIIMDGSLKTSRLTLVFQTFWNLQAAAHEKV